MLPEAQKLAAAFREAVVHSGCTHLWSQERDINRLAVTFTHHDDSGPMTISITDYTVYVTHTDNLGNLLAYAIRRIHQPETE